MVATHHCSPTVPRFMHSVPAHKPNMLQIGGSTYACSIKSGSSGQLLRLVEQSEDSEYVLLVPAAVAGVLRDTLDKALECLADGAR